MSKPSISIDSLSITIGSKKIDLTLGEAQELKRILDETLEPRSVIAPHIVIHQMPDQTWYQAPTWSGSPAFQRPEIMC